jgi:predicted MFS family arabinose efflux permease
MNNTASKTESAAALALAGVQFFFTLGWTVYVIFLPDLLKSAGLAAAWLPLLLMADQLIFAVMDIAFGAVADRMADGYRKLARLLLWLTTISAVAFLSLPMLGIISPAMLIGILLVWVFSASVVRAPTMVLLAKRAKAAQQGRLVIWYAAGMALASALSPFFGMLLKGADPRLPFAISALSLLAAVLVLLHFGGRDAPELEENKPQPIAFQAYVPLLVVLALASGGFQLHAFLNAAPQYLAHSTKENLPWLLPLLWVGFFAALLGVGAVIKRFGALVVAGCGIVLTAFASYASATAASLEVLVLLQLLAGAGWAAAFAGLMEQASVFGTRGAEGLFMGSFFSVLALTAFARIGFVSQLLPQNPALQGVQFILPAALLLGAGMIAALYVWARKTVAAN